MMERVMRIALYIEDGLEQVVLTPESETEKAILGKLHDGSRDISLKRGTFYGCRGGWTRHRERYASLHGMPENEDDSTMIVLTLATPKDTVSPLPTTDDYESLMTPPSLS
jgi:hypothetical protein